MAFKIGANTAYTNDGIPFMWSSGDQTTLPSNQVKIKPSDGAAGDSFGEFNVSTGFGRVVVGSAYDNDNGDDSGSAYIFDLDGTQLAKIKPSDGAAGDLFGQDISIGSGKIVVGAPYDGDNGSSSGSAYIFDLNGTQLAKIKASDGAVGDYFGYSVSVGSGKIVVGAYGDDDNGSQSGSAYIFNLSGTQLAKIKPSDGGAVDSFGSSVAIGCGKIVVGAFRDGDNGSDSGSAYIFDLSGTQLAKIKASDGATMDFFGDTVAIGSGRIVVGAYADDDNGTDAGAAYIFDLDGTQLAKIKASDGAAYENFGTFVTVGSGRIVVGAPFSGNGATYIFDLDGNQLTKITASDEASGDYFGYSVSVGPGRIVVGAYGDDDNGSLSGSAYIFTTPTVYTLYDAVELNSYGQ